MSDRIEDGLADYQTHVRAFMRMPSAVNRDIEEPRNLGLNRTICRTPAVSRMTYH